MTVRNFIDDVVSLVRRATGARHIEVEEGDVVGEIRGEAHFEIQVIEDPIDGGFVATCLNLPGCASQGETVEEALDNLTDAIGGVISARLDRFARVHGKQIEAQVTRRTTTAAPPAPISFPLGLVDHDDRVPA